MFGSVSTGDGARRVCRKRLGSSSRSKRTKRLLCAGTMGRIQLGWMKEGNFRHVHLDGTFCCSTGSQLVCVFGKKRKRDRRPELLFCAVVNGKYREDYDMIFAALKELAPGFSPSTFTGDFEGPMWRSFAAAFGAEFQGCLFHLLDAIGRQLFTKNVPAQLHKEIKDLIRDVAMSPTVPFYAGSLFALWGLVGKPGVEGVSAAVAGSAGGCEAFATYFLESYIDGAVAFPRFWCLKDRSLVANHDDDSLAIDMTNNPAEGVNRDMKAFVAAHKAKGRGDFSLLVAINEFGFSGLLLKNLYAHAHSPDGRSRIPQPSSRSSATSLSSLGAQAVSAVRGQQLDRGAPGVAPEQVICFLLPKLQAFYQVFSPDKVGDAEGLLRGYPIIDVAASLHHKYGSVPEGFPVQQQPLVQAQPLCRSRGHPELDAHLAQLITFFQHVNPAMIAKAESLLSEYSLPELAKVLRDKYGCCADGFGAWGAVVSSGGAGGLGGGARSGGAGGLGGGAGSGIDPRRDVVDLSESEPPPPPPSAHNSDLLRFAGALQLREASSSASQEGCLPPVAGIIGAISRWDNLGDYTICGDHGALVRFVSDGGDCCYESVFHRDECSSAHVRRCCISAYLNHFEEVRYDVSCEMRRHVSIRSGKAGQSAEEWQLKNGWVCEAGVPVDLVAFGTKGCVGDMPSRIFQRVWGPGSRDGYGSDLTFQLLARATGVPFSVCSVVETTGHPRCLEVSSLTTFERGSDYVGAAASSVPLQGCLAIHIGNHFWPWRTVPLALAQHLAQGPPAPPVGHASRREGARAKYSVKRLDPSQEHEKPQLQSKVPRAKNVAGIPVFAQIAALAPPDPSSRVTRVALLPMAGAAARQFTHELSIEGVSAAGLAVKVAMKVNAGPLHAAEFTVRGAPAVALLPSPALAFLSRESLKPLRSTNARFGISGAALSAPNTPAASSFGYNPETGRLCLASEDLCKRINAGLPGMRVCVFSGSATLGGEMCVRLVVPHRGKGACNGVVACEGHHDRALVSALLGVLAEFSEQGPLALLSAFSPAGSRALHLAPV